MHVTEDLLAASCWQDHESWLFLLLKFLRAARLREAVGRRERGLRSKTELGVEAVKSKECVYKCMGFPDGSVGKKPPANAGDLEMQVQSLGWEDPMEKEMVTLCSTPAWKIPWIEEPGRLQLMEPQRVRHDLPTNTHTHTHMLISSMVLMGPHVLTLLFPILR